METQVEEVAENRVRLTVEVPRDQVEHAVEHAASDLAKSVKIPGFRTGKVPMPVLISRVGRERIYSEAIESHIGGWFWSAATSSHIRPVSEPHFDFEMPSSSEAGWQFSAEVEVQPRPTLADWHSLEVGYPDTTLPDGLVEHELDVLRSSVAELIPVTDRPALQDDTLVIDVVNADGEAQRDYVVELGSGRLVGEMEQALVGMQVGETKQIDFRLDEERASAVTVTVKEIKEKNLPPLDDDLARTASEFETLAELRDDIEGRLRSEIEEEAETGFREAVVDRLVESSQVDAKGPLVEARARELLTGLARSLERRGMSLEVFMQMTGQQPAELAERMRENARQSVARELVLETLADELGIEVSDDTVRDFIREQAEAGGEDADGIIAEAWEHGQQEPLREDLRLRAALDRLAGEVKRIPLEQAEAREKIWTPEKEKAAPATKLWTPGSKEST
ncbi:MAG: trigger factor [Gaiellaceae bacterium]